MRFLKFGAASLNQTPLDWKGNLENITRCIDEAQKAQIAVLCLPELCITGYGCEDRFLASETHERALDHLQIIAGHVGPNVVCVGLPLVFRNALYNVVAVLYDQRIVGFVAKQHLAGDGLHYESRWFKPWPSGVQNTVRLAPIGDLIFDFDGVRIGFEICEDAWVAERPGSHLARRGVDVILNPSASHFAFGKHEIRKRFVIEGSRAFGATYVYANLLGNEAGRVVYDGDCMIASGGRLIAQQEERFSMQSYRLLSSVVDVDATKTQQLGTASFRPDLESKGVVEMNDSLFPASARAWAIEEAVKTEPPTLNKYEEFTGAVTLALFDYMRKSRSQGFVVSLSGGADSAACAALAKLMIQRGVQELGEDEFKTRAGVQSEEAHDLITCVYQGTANSSRTTLQAADSVANELGAKFLSLDVDDLVRSYTAKISTALKRELTWEKDDLVLQNIQARVRAPSAWMIANIENKLLLTTSNRSEAAVGYCTMDGDTAGSIAPIGGIDKHFLLGWLQHARDNEDLKSLDRVLVQKPTAELRPGLAQTDEEDLMPYAILEQIEDLAILERKGPRDVFTCLRSATGLPKATVFDYVRKFFRLWCRNQWKRERYALSFHVDDKNLDPRSWCRFPVLSGGFDVELEELRSELGL